jgi:hypothetical protein
MTFKALETTDTVSTRTLLHEAIPITGSILSGTYGAFHEEGNIKTYSHGMFESVFDYPYLSSSANHIFDITVGISTHSDLYSSISTTDGQQAKKRNMYNQMAQVLMGYDSDGNVLQFDEDGNLLAGGAKINDAFIVPFSRLLVKDEIKKGSFTLTLGVDADFDTPFDSMVTISDVSGATQYRANSPVGEYGLLYATQSVGPGAGILDATSTHTVTFGADKYWYCGLLYYQAGIAILTSSIMTHGELLDVGGTLHFTDSLVQTSTNDALTGSQITASADFLRHRIQNVQFNNTTEINSTVHFCRANHNEFNYSSNPTYLTSSTIRVKQQATDDPVAYITTVGLYNDMNELMAVAKLSEPLKKTPSNEFTLRVRLDY